MRVLIQHRSRYAYPQPALLGPQTIRLRPTDHARAKIEQYGLTVVPTLAAPTGALAEHRLHWQRDPHGNHVARLTLRANQPLASLELVVELAVDIQPVNPFDFFVDDRAKQLPFRYPDGLDRELAPYLDTLDPALHLGPTAMAFSGDLPFNGDTVDTIVMLNSKVRERISYVIREEAGVWTPEQTLLNGRGSCRDVGVLMIALMRQRGIAARFVSGYLVQLADEGMIPNEPKGVARDVVDLHAWAEAYVPGAGWIGFDATSGLMCGEGHIALASTASPSTASPLEGTSDAATSAAEFATTITRLGHEVRPTAPYTDEVWAQVQAGGDQADAIMLAEKLEVWIGGEPTFTSRDKTTLEEWQGGALGDDKWERGRVLADALRDRLAPGGLVLNRSGKHYPGESLPRWALDVIGLRDGSALWPVRAVANSGLIDDAKRLGEALAKELEIPASLHPAYEDPWELVRTEALIPIGVDPRTAGLDDPEERRKLAAALDHGAGAVVGLVLPLARVPDKDGKPATWLTDRWKVRREHLFLIPGTSTMGLRLPLSSLGDGLPAAEWTEAANVKDPRRPDDDDAKAAKAKAAKAKATATAPGATPGKPVEKLASALADTPGVRTALTIEPRDGQLWVFVPPLPRFVDFCALVGALDRARVITGLDVHLEGYSPPSAPERFKFAVTPDPGVLEVNLPPVTSCREATALGATVFDTALGVGLTAERYMLDGRLAGSGGGNHITIGGPTPERSPWIARPGMLASLIAFVQHHPALSYAMTGLFVGPTSQAPRVDEARHDSLYELEIALPKLHDDPETWMVDGLLRHMLVDTAGSTHRAEICIDKLLDPGTPFGRQGLVELRAFEMPPHPRMAAAQSILVRALVASFAKAPYRHPLVRWGQELHDKFLLPYWMLRDFEDVLAYLATTGVELPVDAYRPFVELRCPLVGTLPVEGGRVEIRNAIEPWHVLGEETTSTGTARYVDSSIERIEVRTVGVDAERYVVAVNGWALPLRDGASHDVRVGGLRFRAWCPPHALHPHLGIHHPVRIEVIDTWSSRGVAAGAYHVWHPEGQAFDAPPLTRVEAAARRAQRFTIEGPAPSPLHARPATPHPEQPYTFDLRRVDAGKPMPKDEGWEADAAGSP